MKPIDLINTLRKTDFYIEYIFIGGSCYKFHIFLKTFFHDAKPYLNSKKDHIVTEIDGEFYDIKGVVKKKYI